VIKYLAMIGAIRDAFCTRHHLRFVAGMAFVAISWSLAVLDFLNVLEASTIFHNVIDFLAVYGYLLVLALTTAATATMVVFEFHGVTNLRTIDDEPLDAVEVMHPYLPTHKHIILACVLTATLPLFMWQAGVQAYVAMTEPEPAYTLYTEDRSWQIANDAENVSITGTVYYATGAILPNVTVAASINGAAAAGTDAVDAGGQFTITGLTLTGGSIVTLYIDGSAANKAVTVTTGSGGGMTGVNLIKNQLTVRSGTGMHASIGSPITSSMLDTANNNADTDITAIYTNSSQNITVASGKKMWIETGSTLNLGGTLTTNATTSELHLEGNLIQNNNAITLGGTYTQSGGTFTGSNGGSAVTITSHFILDGGTYTATNGKTTLSQNFTHTEGGAFAHNNGTVEFNHFGFTGTANVATNETFYNLTFNLGTTASTFAITSGDTLTTVGTVTLTNGNLNTGTLNAEGNLVHSSTFDGGSATITITGSATRTIDLVGGGKMTSITLNASNVTMNGPSEDIVQFTQSVNPQIFTLQAGTFIGGAGNVSMRLLTIEGGAFTAPSGTLFLINGIPDANTFIMSGGTFNHNNGTVFIAPLHFNQYFDVPSSITFNNFVMAGQSNNRRTLIVGAGDTIIAEGTFTHSGGSIIKGTIEARGNINLGNNVNQSVLTQINLKINGTGRQVVAIQSGYSSFTGALIVAKPSGTVTLSGALTLNTAGQDLIMTGGTLDLNGFGLTVNDQFIVGTGTTLRMTGEETISGGPDHIHRGATIWYDDSAGTNTLKSFKYQNIVIGSTGSATFRPQTAGHSIGGNLTISGGTLDINGGQPLSVSGSWIQSAGTFTAGTGTVKLAGSGTTQTLTATSAFNNLSLNSGLVGYWKMDEGVGTAAKDVSGNGYNGTLNGPTWQTSTPGTLFNNQHSLDFDSTDYINTGDARVNFTNAVSACAWVTADIAGNFPMVFSAANAGGAGAEGFELRLSSTTGRPSMNIDSVTNARANATASTSIVGDGYTHLCGTYDGSIIRMYVNGIADGTTSHAGDIAFGSSGSQWRIGNRGTVAGFPWNGLIDDVRIYNRALSHSEIAALYAGNQSTGSGTYTLGSNLDVDGNLSVHAGTIDAGSRSINLAGNLLNVGGFTKGTSTVTLDGSGNQTVSGSTVFNALSATTSAARTLFFDYTGRQSASGSLTLRGVSGNKLSLRSTRSGSGARMLLDADASQLSTDFAQLDVKDSNASGGQTLVCYTNNEGCTDSGNNTNWTLAAETQSITGKVYYATGAVLPGVTVAASINGAAAAGTDAVDAGGQFTITGLTLTGGSIVTLYIDGSAANKAVTVTTGSGGSMTGITLVKDQLRVRSGTGTHASVGSPITSSMLDTANNNADNDITSIYTNTAQNISVLNKKMWIETGSTLILGGTLSVGLSALSTNELHLDGSLIQNNNAITVNGIYTQSGGTFTGSNGGSAIAMNQGFTLDGGTFISTSGTMSFVSNGWVHTAGIFTHNNGTVSWASTAGAGPTIDVPTSEEFYHLIIANLNTAREINIPADDTLIVNGTLTLTSGAIDTGTIDAKGDIVIGSTFGGYDVTPSTLRLVGTGTQTCTLNAGGAVSAVVINNSAATCTAAGAGTFMFERGMTLTSGTFTGGSTDLSFLTSTSPLIISGGTFNATSGTMQMTANSWTHTAGGTFNHNNGTVAWNMSNSSGPTADVATTEELYNLTIVGSATNRELNIASGDTFVTNGTLTLTSGAIDTGTIDAKGDVVVDSTFGGYDITPSTLRLVGTGTQTCTLNAGGFLSRLTISNASATCAAADAGTFTFEGDFTLTNGTFNGGITDITFLASAAPFVISGGTFNASAGTMQMNVNNWTHTAGGTFNHNNGTVVWTPAASSGGPTIDVAGSEQFYNFTMNGTASNRELIIASGDTVVTNGTFVWSRGALDTGTIDAKGNVEIRGNASGKDVTAGTLKLSGTGEQICTWSAGGTVSNLIMANPLANCIASGTGTITAEDNLIMTGGTLKLNGSNLTVTSVFTVETGTTLRLNGTETLTGGPDHIQKNSTIWYDDPGGTTQLKNIGYQNLVIGSTGSTVFTYPNSGQLNLSGSLTISGGTLAVTNGQNLRFTGSWLKTSAANAGFSAGTGTVTLAGRNQTMSGSTTFYKLTKSVSAADTLTLAATQTQTVQNTLTLGGLAGNLLSLRSSQTGTRWRIDPQGTRSISYVDVKDGNNIHTTLIDPIDSTDSGNNINWFRHIAGIGAVKGLAWNDENGDGIKDASEVTGLSGLSAALTGTTSTGMIVNKNMTTASNGQFFFSGSLLSNPAGYTVTLNSNATPIGYIRTRFNSSGGNVLGTGGIIDVKFGYVLPSTISGAVFIDTNEDGIRDAGETTVFTGATITLSGTSGTGGVVTRTVTTGNSGTFLITGLPTSNGTFTLAVTPPDGYDTTTTNSRSVEIGTGGQLKQQFFGFVPEDVVSSSSSSSAPGSSSSAASSVANNGGGSGSGCRGANCGDEVIVITPEPADENNEETPSPETPDDNPVQPIDSRIEDRREAREELQRIREQIEQRRAERIANNWVPHVDYPEGNISKWFGYDESTIERAPAIIREIDDISRIISIVLDTGTNIVGASVRSGIENIAQSLSQAAKEQKMIALTIGEALLDAAKTVESTRAIPIIALRMSAEGMADATVIAFNGGRTIVIGTADAIQLAFVEIRDITKSMQDYLQRGMEQGNQYANNTANSWTQSIADTGRLISLRTVQVADAMLGASEHVIMIARSIIGSYADMAGQTIVAFSDDTQSAIELTVMRISSLRDGTQMIANGIGTTLGNTVQVAYMTALSAGDRTLTTIGDTMTIAMNAVETLNQGRDAVNNATGRTAIALVRGVNEAVMRGGENARTITRQIALDIRDARLHNAAPALPPAPNYKTTVRKEENRILIGSLHVSVLNSFGEPYAKTPVVLFSTPKIAVTNTGGIATFHDVEAGPHTLEIHTSNGEIKKQELIVEPPADLLAEDMTEADVMLPVVRIVIEEKLHGAARPVAGLPLYVWGMIGALTLSNGIWVMAFVWRRKRTLLH
jgi:hypothetical protein